MRRRGFQGYVSLSLMVFSLTVFAAPVYPDQEKKERDVTIYRDKYGVPHIYAQDVYSLFYGYGYALATDRLFQMEMSKRTVRGTVAEVLGKNYLEFDKDVRSKYSPDSINKQYEALSKAYRDIFDGYAAGMNARIDEVEADNHLLPKEYLDFGFAPSHWSPTDVIMIFVGTMANRYSDFNTEIDNLALLQYLKDSKGAEMAWNIFNQLKWRNDPAAPTTVPANKRRAVQQPALQSIPAIVLAERKSVADLANKRNEWQKQEGALLSKLGLDALSEPLYGSKVFSNCWIVGDKKTVGGGSILMNGPQFGNFVPGYVFEAGLHGAGFNAVGTAPFGYPFVVFGHNDHIAWGSTAALGDLIDIYEEQLNPSDHFQYKFSGQWVKMGKRTDTILVKGEVPATVDIYRTVHGFVVQFDEANHRAFAKKRSWEGFEVQSLVAGIESTKAENYQQWMRQAAKYAITINWYYADRKGNIAFAHTGMFPIRKPGHDGRLPVSGTGEMEWLGIQPFSQNPQVYNPEQGFIANWNNKPADYWDGPDLWFWNWGSADRVQVIIDSMNQKEKFTPADIWDLNKKFSFFDQNVGYFLPFLKASVKDVPYSREAQAVALLEKWNARRVDNDADGKYDNSAQSIMDKWIGVMLKKTFEDDLGPYFKWYAGAGGISGPGELTNGAKILYHCLLEENTSAEKKYDFFKKVTTSQVVFSALTEALEQLQTEHRTADMSQWRSPILPHAFSTTNFTGIPQTSPGGGLSLPIWMNRGTQNDMIVLKREGIHGVNVCPPGQSGFIATNNVKNPHYSDQMELYKDFESKPMFVELRDVKSNMESVIHLSAK